MPALLPCSVLIWFGRPVEPRRTSYVKGPDVTDPPLDVDELHGWLEAWQQGRGGDWRGQVTYAYPVHGLGMTCRFIDWIPAQRLRLLPR
jgi:hypothetical protein